jgi:hypothetical protein
MKIKKSELKQIILEELSSLETGEQRRDFLKMKGAQTEQEMSFKEWVSAVSALGYEFKEASPNPYRQTPTMLGLRVKAQSNMLTHSAKACLVAR